MVLTTEGEVSIGDFGWQVGDVASILRVPRHGLYLADDRHGYLDLGLRNAEEWGFPIGPDFVFTKAFEWEIRTTPVGVRSIGLPHGLCVELKYLDGDEFAHWTDPESFATSFRNKRKRREWEVFNALKDGVVPDGRARHRRARRHPHRRLRDQGVAAPRTPPARRWLRRDEVRHDPPRLSRVEALSTCSTRHVTPVRVGGRKSAP